MTHYLQGVHIRQKVIQLLLREHIAETFHLAASDADDLAHAGIIRRNPAHREVLLLEDSFKSGALATAR